MSKGVADVSGTVSEMLECAAKGRALMGGTKAMREASTTYLPKFGAETDESYKARRDSSWLFNGYRKTVRDMAGRVFDQPVELVDVSPEVEEWAKNIDLQGNDLSTFSRKVFEDALSGPGVSFIMVDAPRRDSTVTRAQARAANLRPYFSHLRVEDVLGWRVEVQNNATKLVQLRIMEAIREPDPKNEFRDIVIDQVRVMDRLPNGIWNRLFRKSSKHDEWTMVDEYVVSEINDITVVPVYINRTGFFKGEPILDDLADVNVAHWQSQSDQRTILHFARVPILFAAGRPDDASPLTISAGMATTASDPSAKLEWVEHSGQAIAAGRQDLKDLEFQMETHGLQLLVARPGAQSATGEALDAAKETSTLSMLADQLQDALENALMWAAEYGGVELGGGSVSVNKEFGVNMMGAQELTALLSAVNTGNMSRKTFLTEMKRRGMVRADLDIDEELGQIEDEGGDLMPMPIAAE